ncbi:MAG: hypothetical protein RIK87_17500 [Fuerstiella sp.]
MTILCRRALTPLLLLLILLDPPPAPGQQQPTTGYAFPATVVKGTSVEVQLGGYDWTPDTQFFVRDEGVQLEILQPAGELLFPGPPHWFGPKAANKAFLIPREVTARFTVPHGYDGDVIRWQVANANGVSPPRELAVAATNDAAEDESVTSAGGEQPLPTPPCTICGRLKQKEEVDHYSFTAADNGLVTCAVRSAGFGHGISAAVLVHDQHDRLVADAADTEGSGLEVTFAVEAGVPYSITLNDIDYRGNRSMVYLLSLTPGPRIIAAQPAAGQRGTTQQFTLTGYGLNSNAAVIESVTRTITFPADTDEEEFAYTFKNEFGTTQHRFALTDHPEITEDRTEETIQTLKLPMAVTGRLSATEPHDDYTFSARQNDQWQIDVSATTLGSVLDVAVAVLDASEKVIVSADDVGGTTDTSVLFKAPSDGEFIVRVTDISGRTGEPTSIYRMAISQPQLSRLQMTVPDSVEVLLEADPPAVPKKRSRGREPQGLLYVDIERPAGFDEDVTVSVSGLPEGMVASDNVVIPAGESMAAIALSSKASSLASLATVTCHADGCADVSARVLIAPVMKPRARVRPLYPDAGRTVHRGATYPAPVVVTRVEGYQCEVRLELAARPDRVFQGISGGELIVPPGVEQIDYPLFLPEWVQIDRTSRMVLNTVTEVPDPQGRLRTLVNRMDQRITMNVEGSLLSVDTMQQEFELAPNQPLEIPVQIFRSPKLQRDVVVSLFRNRDDGETELTSVTLPVGQDSVVIKIDEARAFCTDQETWLLVRAAASDGTELLAMSSTAVVVQSR